MLPFFYKRNNKVDFALDKLQFDWHRCIAFFANLTMLPLGSKVL